MNKIISAFLLLSFCATLAIAGTPISSGATNFSTTVGGRSNAIGGIGTTLNDVFTANNNQGGLGFISSPSFGVYAHRRFVLAGMDYINAAAAIPTKSGTFGLNVNYYGQSLYNEKKIGLGYGRKFGETFSAGIQLDYYGVSIEEYGSRSIFTFEAGMQYQVLKQIMIGAHISNPLRQDLTEDGQDQLESVVKFGLKYTPIEKVSALAEVEKDINNNPVVKAGLDYHIIKELSLRGGFQANPFLGTAGVGIHLKDLDIDVAAGMHPVLGVTPHISLAYAIKKKQQ